jgi:hypothetical protein
MATTHHGKHSVPKKIEDSFEGDPMRFDKVNQNPAVRTVGGSVIAGVAAVEENTVTEQDDPRFRKFEALPDELSAHRYRVFENQDELLEEIDPLEFGSLRIVLDDNGKAYLIRRSDSHNRATSAIVFKFSQWAFAGKGAQSRNRTFL